MIEHGLSESEVTDHIDKLLPYSASATMTTPVSAGGHLISGLTSPGDDVEVKQPHCRRALAAMQRATLRPQATPGKSLSA